MCRHNTALHVCRLCPASEEPSRSCCAVAAPNFVRGYRRSRPTRRRLVSTRCCVTQTTMTMTRPSRHARAADGLRRRSLCSRRYSAFSSTDFSRLSPSPINDTPQQPTAAELRADSYYSELSLEVIPKGNILRKKLNYTR